MAKLTGGKYTRIWTPLAHDILFVDTADGQPLPVQVLSRGTREQLFVSLRLALVAAYARRGIHLPMILDDVFVNFDAGRTKTAVRVLREFASEGHQLLVFTCHEHVWRMFKDMKVDTRRIPNRYNKNDEIVEPDFEPEPEPVVELPAGSAAGSGTDLCRRSGDRIRTGRDRSRYQRVRRRGDHRVRTGTGGRTFDEVEYSWQDVPAQWQAEQERPAQARAAHRCSQPSLRPWPAEPMIHRPDWW